MNKQQRGYSVIVPAYNESKQIDNCVYMIQTILSTLPRQVKWEIVLVNDGSMDSTFQKMLNKAKFACGKILAISYYENRGKGYAVRTGLLNSKYDKKIILDADLSVSPVYIRHKPKVKLGEYYVIKGQRRQVRKQPLYRIFLGKSWQTLTYLLTGLNMDTQCPYWQVKLPPEFYNQLKIDGFAYDVEILYKAKREGIPIHVIPVDYYNDENSSVTFKKTIQMFKDLVRVRFG